MGQSLDRELQGEKCLLRLVWSADIPERARQQLLLSQSMHPEQQ